MNTENDTTKSAVVMSSFAPPDEARVAEMAREAAKEFCVHTKQADSTQEKLTEIITANFEGALEAQHVQSYAEGYRAAMKDAPMNPAWLKSQ